MRSILPLILLEGYLILTLVLLFFGPVTFDLHNVDLFLMYMFIYHIAFILGYYLSIKSFIINKKTINYEYSSFKFYVLLIFGAFSILLTYKNIMMSDSLIPFDIFNEFHDRIFTEYDAALSGPTPIKMKMLGFWEYFSKSFANPQKTYKKIKKAQNVKKYEIAVREIFKEAKNG